MNITVIVTHLCVLLPYLSMLGGSRPSSQNNQHSSRVQLTSDVSGQTGRHSFAAGRSPSLSTKIDRTWLCSWMSLLVTIRLPFAHWNPRPPLIQTCLHHLPALPFHHSQSIPSRHQTGQSPHPQMHPALPYRTRLLAVIHMPLKHIIGQIIVSPRRQAVRIL